MFDILRLSVYREAGCQCIVGGIIDTIENNHFNSGYGMKPYLILLFSALLLLLSGCDTKKQPESASIDKSNVETGNLPVSLFSVIKNESQRFDEEQQKADIDVIRQLIKDGADVNEVNERGRTPLMLALGNGYDLEIIKLLINAGTDVNVKDKEGSTALIKATANMADPAIIKFLLESGADVSVKDLSGHTAIISAALKKSDPKTLHLLIDAGSDIDWVGRYSKNTILLLVAGHCADISVMQKLIERGNDPNAADEHGKTVLMHALIDHADARIIRFLLNAGSDVNAKDNSGYTVLMYAASKNKRPEVVRLLLKAGADVTQIDNWQYTALMEAVSNQAPLSVTRALLKAGQGKYAIVNNQKVPVVDVQTANGGHSALMIAKRYCMSKTQDLIRSFGANTKLKNIGDETVDEVTSGSSETCLHIL